MLRFRSVCPSVQELQKTLKCVLIHIFVDLHVPAPCPFKGTMDTEEVDNVSTRYEDRLILEEKFAGVGGRRCLRAWHLFEEMASVIVDIDYGAADNFREVEK